MIYWEFDVDYAAAMQGWEMNLTLCLMFDVSQHKLEVSLVTENKNKIKNQYKLGWTISHPE